MLMYTQCLLIKNGVSFVSWIPKKFAVQGKFIRVKLDTGWDDGWFVKETYNTLSEEYVLEHERDYKKQREASDI